MPIVKTICPVCGKGGEKDLPFMSGLEDSPIYQSCASHTKSQVRAAYLKVAKAVVLEIDPSSREKLIERVQAIAKEGKYRVTIHEAQQTTYAD